MPKVSITLPKEQIDFIDEIAEGSEVFRSEVFQWIVSAIMEDEDIQSSIFDVEDAEEEEDEDEEESEDEDVEEESETEESE